MRGLGGFKVDALPSVGISDHCSYCNAEDACCRRVREVSIIDEDAGNQTSRRRVGLCGGSE